MEHTDEMIKTMLSLVSELKTGITEYSQKLDSISPEKQREAHSYISEMHQIALKLNEGIEGLKRLKKFNDEMLGNNMEMPDY